MSDKATVEVPPLLLINRAVDAPSIFADSVYYATNISGTVRLSLTEAIAEPAEQPEPGFKSRYVGTIAMSVQSFEDALKYLNGLAEIWKREGRMPAGG